MGSAKILGENEDVVRIMSIHKSKGLEFPVVFLAGAGKQFNLMDLNRSILYHEELGFGPDLVDLDRRISYSTLPKESIKQRIKLETLSEEMRILYVAFTRAKEKLIITGAVSNLEKWASKCCSAAALDKDVIQSSEVLKGKSYLDWIGMAVCKHRDGDELRNIVGAVDIPIKTDLSTWKASIWTKYQLIGDKNIEAVDKNLDSLIDSEIKAVDKEIQRRLGFKYKFAATTNMKSNFSVSDLKKKNYEEIEDELSENLFKEKIEIKPKFLQEEKGLTSAERGTAMHFVMQKLDFSRVDSIDQIKEQLKELVDDELLSKEEFKAIRVNKIFNFFKSNLGKRVLNAYNNGDKVYKELPFFTEISPLDVDDTLPEDIKDEKVRLQGVIDCFFYEGDDIVLIDYKTDYVEEGNEEEMISKYTVQMNYYKSALKKITGKEVKESYLYLFYLDKEIAI